MLGTSGRGTLYSVLRGIQYVAEHRSKIDIANLSLGAACGGDPHNPLARSLSALADLGVASCSAAGNSGPGPGTIETPGISLGTLAVAAVDIERRVARFSSRGPCKDANLKKPDLANYGVNLNLPDHNGQYRSISGTSFAAPLTAGVLAGCWATTGGKNVERSYELMRRSTTPPSRGEAEATGTGIANLAIAAGVSKYKVRSVRRFRSNAVKACLTAAVALIVFAALWLSLDHVGEHPAAGDSDLVLVGRVRQSGQMLALDDGTGVVQIRWTGTAGSAPRVGSVILIQGAIGDSEPGVLAASYRWQLCPTLGGQTANQSKLN